MDDHKIVDLFNERSEQAIDELIQKYGSDVKRVSSNILRDSMDVEESVNETYLRVWNLIPPESPKSLKAFTLSIARNVSLKRFHENNAGKRNSNYDVALNELEECISSAEGVESTLEAKELSNAINEFLSNLDYDDRYAFIRRYYFADSVKAIAKSMKLTPHRVSVRLFRVREKLKEYLRKEGML